MIVKSVHSDKSPQHSISWLWLRKDMEVAHIYGGGSDTPKSRKLEMAEVGLFLEDFEIKGGSDKHLPFPDPQ